MAVCHQLLQEKERPPKPCAPARELHPPGLCHRAQEGEGRKGPLGLFSSLPGHHHIHARLLRVLFRASKGCRSSMGLPPGSSPHKEPGTGCLGKDRAVLVLLLSPTHLLLPGLGKTTQQMKNYLSQAQRVPEPQGHPDTDSGGCRMGTSLLSLFFFILFLLKQVFCWIWDSWSLEIIRFLSCFYSALKK